MKSLLISSVVLLSSVTEALAENWPAWRGDLLGSGKTSEPKVPLEWGPKKNIRWRVALPERGNSTPVVHGERVFVTQAVTVGNWRGLMCFSRVDGSLLWEKGLTYEKKERT
ncbi:MAG: serine/threonine protein kinase, partial [Akkermansiaceae bacterium]